MTALARSPRAVALAKTFQAAWTALADFSRVNAAEANEIYAACAAHVRSAAPMAMLDTGPTPRFDLSDSVVEVVRELASGGRYELCRDGASVRVYLREAADHDAAVALNALEVTRLRSDLSSVAARSER